MGWGTKKERKKNAMSDACVLDSTIRHRVMCATANKGVNAKNEREREGEGYGTKKNSGVSGEEKKD
ncbi:hypothetical protein WN51_08930 [Melipona quadrifasciata]|uniref:Uncharacterized protein n=1 Tax=Melipona quadrifasciata TaxID=166423 RepID=A0A0N1ISZ2_9HYME|nr:hypothetical protein WN51_08930 [Melipona quadrifasciata]